MLGENTNKLVWVAIAVGLVGTLGATSIMIYPDAINSVHMIVSKEVTNFMGGSKSQNALKSSFDFKFSTHDDANGYNLSAQPDSMTLMYWAKAKNIANSNSNDSGNVMIDGHSVNGDSLPDTIVFDDTSLTGAQKETALSYGNGLKTDAQFDSVYTLFSYEGPNYIKSIVESGNDGFTIGDSFTLSGTVTYSDVSGDSVKVPFELTIDTSD